MSKKKLRRRLRQLEARMAALEASRVQWTDVPSDPCASIDMDPPCGLGVEMTPPAPVAPVFDEEEWLPGYL